MKVGSTVFFACAPQYLDPYSLTYGWFGAVWRYEANLRKVEGFWFSTEKEDIIKHAKAKWENWREVTDPIEIKSIYESIREIRKVYTVSFLLDSLHDFGAIGNSKA